MMRENTEFKEVKGVGRIPVDWEVRELKDIIESTELGTNSLGSEDNKGFPMLKMGNLIPGGFNFNKLEKIRYEENELNEKYFLKNSDFLFNTRNTLELVGKSAAWRCKIENAIFNSNIMRIKFNENINNFFMSYYFENNVGWNELKRIAIGTTSVAAIYTKDLYKVKVATPSLKEQEKIAKILSNVDMNIEKTEQAICKYKQVKKGLMYDLLTGKVRIKDGKRFKETRFKDVKGVGKIPWDWEVKELCDICNYVGRGKSPEYKEKSEYKVINQACIYWEGIKDSSMKYVTKDFFESLSKDKKVIKGDILINSTGTGTLGRVIYYDRSEDITYDSHVTKVSIKKGYPPYYAYYFSTDKFQGIIETFCVTGSTNQIELQKSELEKRYVPVFNEKEQIAIAEVLKHQDTLIKKENENLEKLRKLKLGLMADLLTGKVRVKLD